MKKYLKLLSALLALIGVFLMFGTQVAYKWNTGKLENIGIQALVGGKFQMGTDIRAVGSGLAGYILLGAAALILIVVALVPYFKEHDILSMVVTGLAIVCLIVGIILIFLVRKNFSDSNPVFGAGKVYVGWGAIAAGSLGGLAIAFGGLGMILDLSGNN